MKAARPMDARDALRRQVVLERPLSAFDTTLNFRYDLEIVGTGNRVYLHRSGQTFRKPTLL